MGGHVVTRIGGWLGNQMFQYATGFAVATRTDQPLVLDVEPATTWRLGIFKLSPHSFLTPIGALTVGLPPWRSRRGMTKLGKLLGAAHLRAAEFGTFLPDVLDVRESVVLSGQWQSERYFQDVSESVRATFTFAEPFSAEIEKLAETLRGECSVAMHFRRGNYLTDVPQEDLPESGYYLAAYDALCTKLGAKPRIYAFSDDGPWLRATLPRLFPDAISVSADLPTSARDDLHLMSSSQHQIIASSSFSWWAAWLNPFTDKTVIAPRRWVWDWAAPDVVPESWIRV